MKSELLLRIRDAESESDRRLAQAEAEAKQIVADARRQAEAILAEARTQADFAHGSRVESARKMSDKAGAETVAKGQGQASALRKRFEVGADATVLRIVKHFEDGL